MKKTAIILGATGLTGNILLRILIQDECYRTIKLFSRRTSGINDNKVEEYIVDLFELEKHHELFKADVVFCCIGTTQAKTSERAEYKKIDYGIPMSAARLCKQNNIPKLIVISALGADANSRIFYNRTKGELEADVLQLEIEETYLMQPSLIGGARKERRVGERISQILMTIFGFIIPKQYKIIQPETIAKAMQYVAEFGHTNARIRSDKIKELALES